MELQVWARKSTEVHWKNGDKLIISLVHKEWMSLLVVQTWIPNRNLSAMSSDEVPLTLNLPRHPTHVVGVFAAAPNLSIQGSSNPISLERIEGACILDANILPKSTPPDIFLGLSAS